MATIPLGLPVRLSVWKPPCHLVPTGPIYSWWKDSGCVERRFHNTTLFKTLSREEESPMNEQDVQIVELMLRSFFL